MAEGLLKKYLEEAGKSDVKVSSAGIMALDDSVPTAETKEVMEAHGIGMESFKSRRLTRQLIKDVDLILVMENMHRDFIVKMYPEAAAKTHLFKKFGSDNKRRYPEGLDVPDPIGSPIDFYKLSFEIIKEEAKRIADLI
jgi:protein-tyrosine-phosphatase